MQCPGCGMNMGDADECPNCGAKIARHPAHRSHINREPRRGLPLALTLIAFIALLAVGAVVFIDSNACLTLIAQRHLQNGDYTKAAEIAYKLIKRAGPDSDRLKLASDALLAEGEERIDDGKYHFALPLFDEIIKINESAMGTGGSDVSILLAEYDRAICYVKLAQASGEFVEPYGEYVLNAEKSIDRAMELAEKLPDDGTVGIKPDLIVLSAVVAAERASAFWHENNIPQAKIYFNIAEEKLNTAATHGADKDEIDFLRHELDKLRKRLYRP